MCTVIILRRPEHRWPLILGANRDEMRDRPWLPPARHWPERPDVTAGLDRLAGGSWLGINDTGVVAAVLDRAGSLGPGTGKRSRGELVLEALDHADAGLAAEALGDLNAAAWRPFNLVIADNRDAFVLSGDGARVTCRPLAPGLSMVTGGAVNDETDARIQAFLPRFRAAAAPDPDRDDWEDWKTLLAAPAPAGARLQAGLNFQLDGGYGTGSSSLIALPAVDRPAGQRVFLFCDGPAGEGIWRPVLC